MNLLIVTRKVDKYDERTGFFWVWLERFAARLDRLYVICLEQGDAAGLPAHVTVSSLTKGGTKGGGFKVVSSLFKYLRYRKHLKHALPLVDGVFIHMNPIYAVAAGPLVRKYNKPMLLWYAHKSVDAMLRSAERVVAGFITASKESFRLDTTKPVHVTGHGIDVERFAPQRNRETEKQRSNEGFRILTVGRIAPSKRLENLIEAIELLVVKCQMSSVKCQIVGAPALKDDVKYFESLQQLVRDKDLEQVVEFLGTRTQAELVEPYQEADVFVNLSETGSMDKTTLEAMACGTLVVTSNEAYRPMLHGYVKELVVKPGDPRELAEKLVAVRKLSDSTYKKTAERLRQIVIEEHNLDQTINKIIKLYG